MIPITGSINLIDMSGAARGIDRIEIWYATSASGEAPPFLENGLVVNEDLILTFQQTGFAFGVNSEGIVRVRYTDDSGNLVETSLSTESSAIIAGTVGWSLEIPEVEPGHFLWSKTFTFYTDDTYSVTYGVSQYGQNGKPGTSATAFELEINQTEILMFKESDYSTSFSPKLLEVRLYEKDVDAEEGQLQRDLSLEDLKLYLYDGIEFVEIIPIAEVLNGAVVLDIKEILKNQESESILKIQCKTTIDDKVINTSVYPIIRYALNKDMANLSISANGIVSAIQETKIEFNANGLTVKNGGISILNKGNKKVLWADDGGNLHLTGAIEATSGSFKGTIEAESGTFTGKITAIQGSIGGFIIENERLYSKAQENGSPLVELRGMDGKIIAKNIEIGSGAKITSHIQLGNRVKLLNPDLVSSNNNFIAVNDTQNNTILSINSLGFINIGDENNRIFINGPEGKISSYNYTNGSTLGWELSNSEAIFNNITARGAIKAAVFSYGETQAIGGTLIVRPSAKIQSVSKYSLDGEEAYEVALDSYEGFEVFDWCLLEDGNQQFQQIIGERIDPSGGHGTFLFRTLNNPDQLVGKPIVSFGKNGEVGISINGSENGSFVPSQSISVFEFNESTHQPNPKIILGKLPNLDTYGAIKNTYGLYAENALLKGSLITESLSNDSSKAIYCGINTLYGNDQSLNPTSAQYAPYFTNETGNILFWAGALSASKEDIEDAPFLVDEYGNLVARSGYFKGSIITDSKITASEIETAILTGPTSGSGAALTIKDATNGIIFKGGDQTVFSLGLNKMSANISQISFNDYFKIGKNGESFAPTLYITNESAISTIEEDKPKALQLENNRIKLVDFDSENVKNSKDRASIEFSSSIGFTPENALEAMLLVGNQQTRVNSELYINKTVNYSDKIIYQPVYEDNELIGYDLYVK